MIKIKFIYEDLEIWRKSIEFAKNVIDLSEQISCVRKHYRLLDQIESAATSIPLNIAEGKGRYSKREFIQFLYIARGSLFESLTLLKIFQMKKWINSEQLATIEIHADEISRMLSGLIRSIRDSLK